MNKMIEKYKEIKNMPKGNAYLFFGFYFIFFLIIILILSLSPKTESVPAKDAEEELSYLELGDITNNIYQFQYIVVLDGVEKKYTGKRNQDKELFTYQNKNYYFDGEYYYVKNDNEWSKTENPYLYNHFRNITKISKFLEESYVESETVYKSGKEAIRFFLDTNTIYQTLYDRNTDFDDNGNTVVVNTVDDEVQSIVFQLDSFCKSNSSCKKSLKLEIQFENIGEVEEIKKPF